MPIKMDDKEFDSIVAKAIENIPYEIRQYLDNIVISVKKRPSRLMMREMGIPPGECPLGLFQGVPLTERSATIPPLYPDMIYLFQEPLEEMCNTREELEEEIEITVVHEVAHYIGMTEERLEELGYG
ncbi:MAG: metallopeptidase family protein [Syntrophorhabdaceae bacterium]|nr:metallopeptidase family protein [Syntrophorhabdaceae bacterium]MDD4196325.1 metallopeptidase family protein [Syntrophorhabdaceae bacterium]HOC46422.1 metallopeptidase family protein [Syntrophorhabdaceae bacterium]